ncbi:hypothetical protein BAC2_02852, partial [uncultured bacterium]
YIALLNDGGKSPRMQVVKGAAGEVGGAIFTSVATTVISFIPIFALSGQSYKLFAPMAWTKSLTLTASLFLAICLAPVLCYLCLGGRRADKTPAQRRFGVTLRWVAALGMAGLVSWITVRSASYMENWLGLNVFFVAIPAFVLTTLGVLRVWSEPLTPIDGNPVARGLVAIYVPTLRFFLSHKQLLRVPSLLILLLGLMCALGASFVLAPVKSGIAALGGDPARVRPIAALEEHYPGFGQEFMPPLDEGSLLYMPSLLSQASLSETLRAMNWQNDQIMKVPEVELAMGKLGRAETALDPAPIGMIETVVLLKPKSTWRKAISRALIAQTIEERKSLNWLRRELREGNTKDAFLAELDKGLTATAFAAQIEEARSWSYIVEQYELEPEERKLTLAEEVIFNLHEDVAKKHIIADLRHMTHQPGVAPSWLQPIQTRVVMLSSGIRSRIGLEILGDDASTLSELALALEPIIKSVPGASDVVAMRTGGKPYVQYKLRYDRMQHYGVQPMMVQDTIEVALGGKRVTTTVERRERYPVRVRYERELRDKLEDLERVLVSAPSGAQVPITELADIEYVVGPSEIRGANGKVAGYVTFNTADIDETSLIAAVEARLKEAIDKKEIDWPKGYTFNWVGQYQEQQKTNERLTFIIPLVLAIIFFVIYLHFRKWSWTLIVFTGLPLNLAGGAIMIRYWPFIQSLFTGEPQGPSIYVTVAVIVGFMVLAGVVLNDGVVVGTYIDQL